MPSQTSNPIVRTHEDIIDMVRKHRNDLIKDFLDERFLKTYLEDKYRVHNIAPVKIEFIKSELKEKLISPVDLVHYKNVIDDIKQNDRQEMEDENDTFFYKEIDSILKRYIY
jgi:hypothetical protein